MSKHSYSRHKGEKKGISVGGCIGAIVLSMLWFCVVCFLMFDVIPKEKQVGMFYDISLLVLLLLPLYIDIKLLCRLIAKIVRLFVARRKSKSLSNHSADLHSTPPDDVANTTMPPVSQDPTPPTPQNPTPSIPQIPLAPERRITQTEIRTTAPPAPKTDTNATIAFYADALFEKSDKVNSELLSIDLMEGRQFEIWCAEALKSIGFANVTVTPGSGDQGVDVLAEKEGVKYAFQCKRYNSDLGNAPIQEVHSGKDYYHRHVGVVITNQKFTSNAVSLARETGTLLWDREWITNYLNYKYEEEPKVFHYSPLPTVPPESYEDELFNPAVEIVLKMGSASVSIIQRQLKLGYARAARLVDKMEEQGIVGPFEGAHPRAVLITQEEWDSMKQSSAE